MFVGCNKPLCFDRLLVLLQVLVSEIQVLVIVVLVIAEGNSKRHSFRNYLFVYFYERAYVCTVAFKQPPDAFNAPN